MENSCKPALDVDFGLIVRNWSKSTNATSPRFSWRSPDALEECRAAAAGDQPDEAAAVDPQAEGADDGPSVQQNVVGRDQAAHVLLLLSASVRSTFDGP